MADIFRKAMTLAAGLFKPTDQRQTKRTVMATTPEETKSTVEETRNSDSDAEDEDYNPDAVVEDPVSEEGSDDKTRGKSAKKRKSTGKSGRGRRKRRKADSDDSSDEDFTFRGTQEDNQEDVPTAEEAAAQEALEKAETDRLWESFLTDVKEDEKRRKNRSQASHTVDKVVDKVIDFAGEKVTVQETIKVTLQAEASDKEPATGPVKSDKPRERRGGISILGNDPETIGLDDMDKRGLSGLIKAFQNKEAAAAARRIGTLEKSKLDWEQYKRKTGLEEELTHHNRSKDTYIDKQEFLQRADHRQFEIEKNMRATQRSKRLANQN